MCRHDYREPNHFRSAGLGPVQWPIETPRRLNSLPPGGRNIIHPRFLSESGGGGNPWYSRQAYIFPLDIPLVHHVTERRWGVPTDVPSDHSPRSDGDGRSRTLDVRNVHPGDPTHPSSTRARRRSRRWSQGEKNVVIMTRLPVSLRTLPLTRGAGYVKTRTCPRGQGTRYLLDHGP